MVRTKILTEQQAYRRFTKLCATAEYCSFDIMQRLLRANFARNVAEQIVARLEDEGYIDNSRYARAYVNDKLRFSNWGRHKITLMLQAKRIDRNAIADALSVIDPEEYMAILKRLIDSRRSSTSAENEFELNMKLMRFATSRGFELELIRQCINTTEDYDTQY